MTEHIAHNQIVCQQCHDTQHFAYAIHLMANFQVIYADLLVAGESDELQQTNHARRQQRNHQIECADTHANTAAKMVFGGLRFPLPFVQYVAAFSATQNRTNTRTCK